MCVVSMIGDHYQDKWKEYLPNRMPSTPYTSPSPLVVSNPSVSKQDFDALKAEVLEMKALLKKAIEYDKKNGEPACQLEEKYALIREIAKMVGVEIEDVIGAKKE